MELSLNPAIEIGLPGLVALVGFVFFVAAALLLLSWLQQRQYAPLGLWGLAFGLAAAGTLLLAVRGQLPDFWTIVVANALLAVAYGTMWCGARRFGGRRTPLALALAGAIVWLVAMLDQSLYLEVTFRSGLMTVVGCGYTLATAYELWRSRDARLPSRGPAIALLLVHALALPVRIPLVANWLGTHPSHAEIVSFAVFESILLAMAGAYLFGGLVREQVAARYRMDASVDPLTGVANRRAFFQRGTRLLQREEREGRSLCLLLFDIDLFKAINDAYGHPAGDMVLKSFCRVVEAQIRPTDFLGRIGGEEFACLLVGASAADAAGVAERVRHAFEQRRYSSDGVTFGATVSIGIAVAGAPYTDMTSLLISADRALYRAKRAGRNRVAEDRAGPRIAAELSAGHA